MWAASIYRFVPSVVRDLAQSVKKPRGCEGQVIAQDFIHRRGTARETCVQIMTWYVVGLRVSGCCWGWC